MLTEEIQKELNNNPIYLKMEEILKEKCLKGEDIKKCDFEELYEDAKNELILAADKLQRNKEAFSLLNNKVWLAINSKK